MSVLSFTASAMNQSGTENVHTVPWSLLAITLFLLSTEAYVTAVPTNSSACVGSCRCAACGNLGPEHNTSAISCANASVPAVIRLLDGFQKGVCSLDISASGDAMLRKASFQGLQELQLLRLSRNGFSKIAMFAFVGLRQLRFLYLDNNHMPNIRRASLNELKNLEILDVSYNEIKNVKANQFSALISLKHLHLDHNAIDAIQIGAFRGLGRVENLDLSHNQLVNLSAAMFRGLTSLRHLDLSFNKLQTFRGTLLNEMPNLEHVNTSGNVNFNFNWSRPQNKSTVAPTTSGTRGSRPPTKNCCTTARRMLTRARTSDVITTSSALSGCFYKMEERQLFHGHVASAVCRNRNCSSWVKVRTTRSNICWDLRRKLRFVELVLGVAALLLNLAVLVTVSLSPNLRKSVSFALVAHLAFCDILLSIYSLGVARGHSFQTRTEFFQWRDKFCPFFRSVFILNQVLGVITATLTTLERYFAIVFCMNPDVRLRRKPAAVSLLVTWTAGIGSCIAVQMSDAAKRADSEMCLIYRNSSKVSRLFLSEILLFIVGLIYILIFAMYVHIYVAVRRCTRDAGINRESKLARRIGLIVLSSTILFVVPNVLLAVFIVRGGGLFTQAVLNKTLLWWLPPMLLVVNSCMNPCFFGFRNDMFVQQFKRLMHSVCRCRVPRRKPLVVQSGNSQDTQEIGLTNLAATADNVEKQSIA